MPFEKRTHHSKYKRVFLRVVPYGILVWCTSKIIENCSETYWSSAKYGKIQLKSIVNVYYCLPMEKQGILQNICANKSPELYLRHHIPEWLKFLFSEGLHGISAMCFRPVLTFCTVVLQAWALTGHWAPNKNQRAWGFQQRLLENYLND